RDVGPADAAVAGLPDPAARPAEVVHRGLVAHARHRHHASAAVRADRPPLQAAQERIGHDGPPAVGGRRGGRAHGRAGGGEQEQERREAAGGAGRGGGGRGGGSGGPAGAGGLLRARGARGHPPLTLISAWAYAVASAPMQLPEEIQRYYDAGLEGARLGAGAGIVELARTQ